MVLVNEQQLVGCNSKTKQVAKPTECKSSTAGKTTVDTKPTK